MRMRVLEACENKSQSNSQALKASVVDSVYFSGFFNPDPVDPKEVRIHPDPDSTWVGFIPNTNIKALIKLKIKSYFAVTAI